MAYESKLDFDFAVTHIISVVERPPDPNWRMSISSPSPHFVLCAALEGEASYQLSDRESLIATAGDAFFFSNARPRSAYAIPERPWHFISTTFELCTYNEKSAAQLARLPLHTREIPPTVMDAFRQLNTVWTGRGMGYVLKCRALLEGILYDLMQLQQTARQNIAHYTKIEQIRRYIQEHYTQTFTVEELAAQANCSYSHFRTLFKTIVGMTATQYQAMVRVYKAKDFLLSGEMNVSEAAARTGYHDIFYFSRQFKALTGHPPSYYANAIH